MDGVANRLHLRRPPGAVVTGWSDDVAAQTKRQIVNELIPLLACPGPSRTREAVAEIEAHVERRELTAKWRARTLARLGPVIVEEP